MSKVTIPTDPTPGADTPWVVRESFIAALESEGAPTRVIGAAERARQQALAAGGHDVEEQR